MVSGHVRMCCIDRVARDCSTHVDHINILESGKRKVLEDLTTQSSGASKNLSVSVKAYFR